jgi:hypothetical protein
MDPAALKRREKIAMRKEALLLLTTIVGTVLWIGAAPPRCGAG